MRQPPNLTPAQYNLAQRYLTKTGNSHPVFAIRADREQALLGKHMYVHLGNFKKSKVIRGFISAGNTVPLKRGL